MSTYQTLVALHGLAGGVALVTFWAAAFLRKGSLRHRRAGQVFLVAMVGILVTATPMAWIIHRAGKPVIAAFLAYLVVIVAAATWRQWRAVRDRARIDRYAGPVFVALALLSVLAGTAVLALGIRVGSPLLMGFSVVGLFTGSQQLYARLHRERLAARRRWWLSEHYSAAIANGSAVHIAFFAIGLPRLLPAFANSAWAYVGWFAPLLVAIAVLRWLDRRERAFG